jgi:hypothetical protein
VLPFLPGAVLKSLARGDRRLVGAMKFLDQVKVYVKSGAGGGGGRVVPAREVHRVRRPGRRRRRPRRRRLDRGGRGLNTLIDYRYQQHFKAGPASTAWAATATARTATTWC